ncbi:restriction endonuclease subunit S [Shewanella algidipiscicola]|uniref:restriction endonuclease subunit S n=1 Tax=Shewanella algidipiscicola TaxID=614070 RepID=UPI001950F33D|nr:restriction endonuclease subunit S [Shewanella algidipiscicola]
MAEHDVKVTADKNSEITAEQLITENLDIWTTAIKQKSASGRGSSKKFSLHGIKKLRELILELAVRGKLVPQDENDEPASILLERIAAEKAQLVKDKKIKKPKALPEISEDEKPFELPKGWEWTRLTELAEIGPRNSELNDDSEASFVPMPLITTSYKGSHGSETRTWKEIKKGYTHFADGDIALAKITPCFENSKAAVFSGLINGVGTGTTELHVARPIPDTLNPLFILLYLKAPMFLKVGETKMTGSAGQKRVPKDFFANNPLPFAPLEEQYRIVAKVDELMSLCDALEAQTEASKSAHQTLVETLLGALLLPSADANSPELAESPECSVENGSEPSFDNSPERHFIESWQRVAEHFDTLFTTSASIDTLKQTILQLAVMGKLVEQNSNDEPAAKLLERIAIEKMGLWQQNIISKPKPNTAISTSETSFHKPLGWEWVRLEQLFNIIVDCPHSTAKFQDSGLLCLDTNSFKQGKLHTSKFRFVSQETFDKRNARLVPLPRDIVFAREGSVGESVVIPDGIECCLGQRVMLFRPSVQLEPEFLRLTISSKGALEKLLSIHKGIGAKHVNVRDMRAYLVCVPPKEEQRRIVTKVDELITLCDQLKARLSDAQTTQLHLTDAIVEQAV